MSRSPRSPPPSSFFSDNVLNLGAIAPGAVVTVQLEA